MYQTIANAVAEVVGEDGFLSDICDDVVCLKVTTSCGFSCEVVISINQAEIPFISISADFHEQSGRYLREVVDYCNKISAQCIGQFIVEDFEGNKLGSVIRYYSVERLTEGSNVRADLVDMIWFLIQEIDAHLPSLLKVVEGGCNEKDLRELYHLACILPPEATM